MKRVQFVLFGMFFGALGATPALADDAEKATELLARSWIVDNRCNVLSRSDRDDLTGFVARAEIALAEQQSVKIAREAIAKGRAAGTTMPCDAKSAQSVRDILNAAKSALAMGDVDVGSEAAAPEAVPEAAPEAASEAAPGAISAVEPEKPVEIASSMDDEPVLRARSLPIDNDLQTQTIVKSPMAEEKLPPEKPKIVEAKAPVQKRKAVAVLQQAKPAAKKQNPAGAANYRLTAENYYLELRCRNLPVRAMNAMYARVLEEHRQAVAANGKTAVRKLLRAAEARAASRSCS